MFVAFFVNSPSKFRYLCRGSRVLRDCAFFVSLYILLFGMSGMEAASAGIALVGFVATTIQQLNKLITIIRSAQGDLSGLLEYLKQLESSLTGADSLIRRLAGNADQHESIIKIERAVKYCYKTLKSLEVLVEKINGSDRSPNKLKKTMTSLKYFLKKDDILEVQNRLEYAMSNLNLAISIDDSHR